MITFVVPLSPYRVLYSVAVGRRYYELDRLLLRAIAEGEAPTIREMEELFRLPRRMLIEVLVTLLEDDAIQLRSGSVDAFELTPSAREAVNKSTDIARTGFRLEDRVSVVMMERLTGGLIHQSEVSYESRYALVKRGYWERCQALPSDYYYEELDEGQVRPFLRPGRDYWLHRIREVEYAGGGTHWLPVDVDPEGKQVFGLPAAWHHRLAPVVLEYASRYSGPQTEWRFWKDRAQRTATATMGWNVEPTDFELAFTAEAHYDWLRKALVGAPESSTILIASPVLNPSCLDSEVRDLLYQAVLRGVHIDLLWGRIDSVAGLTGGAALDGLRRLSEDLKSQQARGSLRFNTRPHACDAAMLVSVGPSGAWAAVGSYRWLADPIGSDDATSYCSVRTTHAGLIAELSWSASAFLIEAGQLLATSPYRWRTIAGDLERIQRDTVAQPPISGGGVHISLVRDSTGILEELVDQPGRRVLILSRDALAPSVATAIDNHAPSATVIMKSGAESTESGAYHPGLRAEILANEVSVIIASSQLAHEGAVGRPKMVAIRISSGAISESLWNRFGGVSAIGGERR